MPNSATLVQALGAAFCAILCALSGMGGGRMLIGARTAAWSGNGMPYIMFNQGVIQVPRSDGWNKIELEFTKNGTDGLKTT